MSNWLYNTAAVFIKWEVPINHIPRPGTQGFHQTERNPRQDRNLAVSHLKPLPLSILLIWLVTRFYQFSLRKSTVTSFPTIGALFSGFIVASSDYWFASWLIPFSNLISLYPFFQVNTNFFSRTSLTLLSCLSKIYHSISTSGQNRITGTKFILLPEVHSHTK